MLKTIGTTALVIVAMLSCGTAQATLTPEMEQRVQQRLNHPKVQAWLEATSKEEIMRQALTSAFEAQIEIAQLRRDAQAVIQELETQIKIDNFALLELRTRCELKGN